MNILLSPMRSPRAFNINKNEIEEEAFKEWLRANKQKKRRFFNIGEESTLVNGITSKSTTLPPVRRKRARWMRPSGVSAWGKMKDERWKEDRFVLDIDPGPQGVNLSSSRHRNPGSIPPLGVKSGVKKKPRDVDCGVRHPPVGSYSLPDLWEVERKKKYPSRFAKEADEVLNLAQEATKDSWTVFSGKHTLPFYEEDRVKIKKRPKKVVSPTKRRDAVILEGKDSAFADGRDNLLIHALLREEQERKLKILAKGMKNEEKVKEEDEAFEAMFNEHVKPNTEELQVIIAKSEQEVMEAL